MVEGVEAEEKEKDDHISAPLCRPITLPKMVIA